MEIYFIRHGETEYNRRALHQHPDVPLSERGRQQMEKTAAYVTAIGATKLISSDMRRAVESATYVSDATGLTLEKNELFREIKRPSVLYNKPHISLATVAAGVHILAHLENPAYHYGDEENIFDIQARVVRAVEYLKSFHGQHDRIIVVSHALIINLFVQFMCNTKRVRRRDYIKSLISAKRYGNASITMVRYDDDGNPNTCDFLCLTINSQEHLA